MTLKEYIERNRAAFFANPPRNQGNYQDDPVSVWRYYMRTFGTGLDIYPEKDVVDELKSLYSSWFVRLEFNSHMPDIDAKQFIGWALSAREEVLSHA